ETIERTERLGPAMLGRRGLCPANPDVGEERGRICPHQAHLPGSRQRRSYSPRANRSRRFVRWRWDNLAGTDQQRCQLLRLTGKARPATANRPRPPLTIDAGSATVEVMVTVPEPLPSGGPVKALISMFAE